MDKLTLSHSVSEDEIQAFSNLLKISNLTNLSVVTSILVQGLISSAVGKLLGNGAVYREQNTHYLSDVELNDTLTLNVEISEIQEKRAFKLAKIKIECYNKNNKLIARGEAIGIPPKTDI